MDKLKNEYYKLLVEITNGLLPSVVMDYALITQGDIDFLNKHKDNFTNLSEDGRSALLHILDRLTYGKV